VFTILGPAVVNPRLLHGYRCRDEDFMASTPLDPDTFLSILRSVRREFEPSMLGLPFPRTPLDSLDLLELRSALEVHMGEPIDDLVWTNAPTPAALLEALS